MEENQTQPEEEPQPEEKTEVVEEADKALARREARVEDTTKDADKLQMSALEEKEKKLEKMEKTIDKKNRELKKLIREAETHGKSLAGDAVTESDEDKGKREANEYLKSTGLKAFPDVE